MIDKESCASLYLCTLALHMGKAAFLVVTDVRVVVIDVHVYVGRAGEACIEGQLRHHRHTSSAITTIMQNTNLMMGGKRLVVLGYGWCGKGIARYAAGLGARVTVCEIDPVRDLEAYADGFDVLPALEACEEGEIFITATGSTDVLTTQHFERMREGAILANAGGVDVEIDVESLKEAASGSRVVRRSVEEFTLGGGRKVYLVGRGMVVNLTAGDGHPIEIMDLTFAIQALCAHHLANNGHSLESRVHLLPKEIDDEVARIKLDAVGMGVDALTPEQEEFLAGWRE